MNKAEIDAGRSNVFYDTLPEMMNIYNDVQKEIWETKHTVCLYDTDGETGLFDKSDIIIIYDEEGYPVCVTERIYRSDYTFRQWHKIRRSLRLRVSTFKEEFGYRMSLSVQKNALDFIHYKEEYAPCVRRK